MKMLYFIGKAIVAACVAVALAVSCKPEDPAAGRYLVPRFRGVEVDESVPGSVAFTCSVSSMERLAEYGMYVTAGGPEADTGSPATRSRIEGRRLSDSSFAVSLNDLLGGATYSCNFFMGNGRVEVLSEPVIYYAPQPAIVKRPMRLRVRTGEDGFVYLPLRGSLECLVDWGDGTKDQLLADYGVGYLATGYVSHSYSAQGEYEVSVSGSVTALSSFGLPYSDCILAVSDWGDTGLQDLSCAFLRQASLVSVALPAKGVLASVGSVREAFSGTALTQIPSGLFDDCPAACDYTRVFAACESLACIPEALFPSAESLRQCFSGCTSLTALSEKLLDDGSALRQLQETFAGCTSLAAVPAGIFSDCPALERMVSTFSGCTALESLPESLFDSNRSLTNIEGLFMNCSSLKGESPYTVVDGEKVHLYERDGCPAQFSRIASGYLSFLGCTGLADYPSIPGNWKKP